MRRQPHKAAAGVSRLITLTRFSLGGHVSAGEARSGPTTGAAGELLLERSAGQRTQKGRKKQETVERERLWEQMRNPEFAFTRRRPCRRSLLGKKRRVDEPESQRRSLQSQ